MTRLGIVVGLRAEARIARSFGADVLIAAGGGTASGAERAAEQVVAAGARRLLSFGLAGALDPSLRPGTLVVPARVIANGTGYETDCAWLGGATADAVIGDSGIVSTAQDKHRLFGQTAGVAVDCESGPVSRVAAARGIPFTVLRAICDPAERTLPPAALLALDQTGAIGLARVLGSVLRAPGQMPALVALARDAGAARTALKRAALRYRT